MISAGAFTAANRVIRNKTTNRLTKALAVRPLVVKPSSPRNLVGDLLLLKKEENNGYWNAPRRQTFQYDFLDNNELPKM